MKKALITLVVLAGLSVLGWQVYEKISEEKKTVRRQRGRPPVAVEVARAAKTSIRDIGRFTGSLYPESEFVVAPKIAGRLEKILVDIGDRVSGGQLIAVLDDEEHRQQVSQLEAELEVAKANLQERQNTLENAQREYQRTEALRKKKIASVSQLDAAGSALKNQQAKLKVANAQVAQKTAALNMAKVRLSYTRIRIPEDRTGAYRVVGERFVDEGAMMSANKAIVSVIDIGKLTAAIHVIERDYPKIQQGLVAAIRTDAYPRETFRGKVSRIAPLLKEKSREAKIELEIPNDRLLLKPGMFVRAEIEFDTHQNATVVPTSALIKRDGRQGIFIADLKEKTARFVPVTVGIVNGPNTEILEPAINSMVVTLGQHLLQSGSKIILPSASSKSGSSKKGKRPARGEKGKPGSGGQS